MSITPSFGGVRIRNFYDPFPLDDWEPFKDFHFQSSLITAPHGFPSSETTSFVNARMDWNETPEAHVFKIELPGFSKNEVSVQVEDGKVVKISGERNTQKEEKDGEWHRVERSSGKFLRAIRLPENGRAEKVKSSMENGVLTVTVPKKEAKKRHHVKQFKELVEGLNSMIQRERETEREDHTAYQTITIAVKVQKIHVVMNTGALNFS